VATERRRRRRRRGEAGSGCNGEDVVLAIGVQKCPRRLASEAVGSLVERDRLAVLLDNELADQVRRNARLELRSHQESPKPACRLRVDDEAVRQVNVSRKRTEFNSSSPARLKPHRHFRRRTPDQSSRTPPCDRQAPPICAHPAQLLLHFVPSSFQSRENALPALPDLDSPAEGICKHSRGRKSQLLL
jgi:hypothetical protein